METPPETAPLSGIRVIDAGQILAAPFCSTLLGEFGADVIKVEPPGTGDANRGSVSFAQDNRGQKSVTLDVTRPDGAALFRRLCDVSDILVENNRPGALEKWGLAPETLRESNPGLVVVRISGYGQTGPYRDRAGFDRVALAFAGITALTGYRASRPFAPATSWRTMAPASSAPSVHWPPSAHATSPAVARMSTWPFTRPSGG